MKQLCMLVIMFFITSKILAQQVGIGTTTPHASAALHIDSDNKGVLFPRINLPSKTDNVTIPNPSIGLVIYHNNPNTLDGRGLYINTGSGASPSWEKIGKQQFILPYYGYLDGSGAATNALEIQSDQNKANSAAIRAAGSGITTGISTFSAAGLALDVQGQVKISGNGQAPGAGKVLTSDASGNASWQGAVAFSASGVVGGGSDKIATNFTTKVPFANVDYDLGGNYQNANGTPHSTFIATENGIYHFDVNLLYLTNNGETPISNISLIRKRNGVETEIKQSIVETTPSSPNGSLAISTDCQLLVDDQVYVTFYFYKYNGFIFLQTESTNAGFSGRLVIKQ